jgi:hypothetical protein
VSTRSFCCSPETNLSKVPWSFDAKAALTPLRLGVVSASGKVDAVVFFIALEIPRVTPLPYSTSELLQEAAVLDLATIRNQESPLSNNPNLQAELMLPLLVSIV